MAQQRTIVLSAEQRRALERARDGHRLASVRERATAVLLVADGQSLGRVAQQGYARPKKRDTIGTWLGWYETGGLAALIAHQHGGARRGRLRPRHARAGAGAPAAGASGIRGDAQHPVDTQPPPAGAA